MIIYKATNTVNGKVYIGQTTKTLKRRKSVHYNNAKCGSDNYFHKAIMKYGIKYFTWEILCKCDSLDELNQLEMYHIEDNTSLVPFGYNMTGGGHSSPMINPSDELKQKHQENTKNAMQSFRGENNPMKRPEVIKNHKIAVNNPERRKRHSEWMKNNYRHSEQEKMDRRKHYVTLEKNGIQFSVINLKQWCKDNSYNYASFRQLLKRGSRSYKDLIIIDYEYICDKSQPSSAS